MILHMDGLPQFRADHNENTINPGCDIMTNRSWLKQEIPQWVKEDVISEDAGKKILSRYKKKDGAAYKEAFFILAVVCIIGGIFSSAPACGMDWTRISAFCWLWRPWRFPSSW